MFSIWLAGTVSLNLLIISPQPSINLRKYDRKESETIPVNAVFVFFLKADRGSVRDGVTDRISALVGKRGSGLISWGPGWSREERRAPLISPMGPPGYWPSSGMNEMAFAVHS